MVVFISVVLGVIVFFNKNNEYQIDESKYYYVKTSKDTDFFSSTNLENFYIDSSSKIKLGSRIKLYIIPVLPDELEKYNKFHKGDFSSYESRWDDFFTFNCLKRTIKSGKKSILRNWFSKKSIIIRPNTIEAELFNIACTNNYIDNYEYVGSEIKDIYDHAGNMAIPKPSTNLVTNPQKIEGEGIPIDEFIQQNFDK